MDDQEINTTIANIIWRHALRISKYDQKLTPNFLEDIDLALKLVDYAMAQGAIVYLKADGLRERNKYTAIFGNESRVDANKLSRAICLSFMHWINAKGT